MTLTDQRDIPYDVCSSTQAKRNEESWHLFLWCLSYRETTTNSEILPPGLDLTCFCFLCFHMLPLVLLLSWSRWIFPSYFLCLPTPVPLRRGMIEGSVGTWYPSKANLPQKKLLDQRYTEWLIIPRLKTNKNKNPPNPAELFWQLRLEKVQNINCYTLLFIFIPGQFALNYFWNISGKSEKSSDHL